MTRISKYLIIFSIFIFSLTAVKADNKPNPVPAAPNESLVTAKILEIKKADSESLNIKPQQLIYSFKLLIKEVKDTPNKTNFLKNKTGQTITAYYKPESGPCGTKKEPFFQLRPGVTAEFKIEFRGDEKHKSYWIIDFVTIVNS